MTLGWPKSSSSDNDAAAAQSDSQSSPVANINSKNVLNLLFFILNVVFVYGIGTLGWVGNGNNNEISEKYQTIITPSGKAFSIWAVIYIFQGAFTIAQLFKRFRGHALVQQGVSFWYAAVCLAQIGWTFSFAYEVIPLSLVFMLAILSSLYGLLYSQYYTESDGSLWEFWLLRFPFSIHAGWITAASALNTNVVAVWKVAPATIQLALGIVSLAVLHAVSVWVLFNLKKSPNYTMACVLAWANGWIYSELQSPKELILQTFSQDIIDGVAYAAVSVAFIIVTQVVVRVVIAMLQKYKIHCPSNINNQEDDSTHESADVEGEPLQDVNV